MSYNRKTWINRNSEHPYRRTLTDTTSGTTQTVDVTRAEGTVSTEGDVFDANTMNNMEGRIANEFTAVDQKIGDLQNLDTTAKNNLVAAINEVAAGGGGGGSSTLSGLSDVSLLSPSNGQVLKYNGTSNKWENANESGGTGENYVVITYTTSKASYDSGVVASDFTKTSIVDQDGNAVSDGDVFDLIFSNGYGARLALVYSNTTYSIEMSHKVYAVPSGYSLSFPLFDVEILNNPAIIRTEVDVTFTGNVFSLIYEEYDYAPLHSPAFTGSPTAPTASVGHSGTRIATTAFVNAEIDNDTKYHVGDSFSVAGTACLFLQTGTSARITIPLCKPVGSDVTSAANSGNWEIRDCNGSTTNGDKTTSGHPLSYYVTTPSSDLKVNIGTNSINVLMTNLKASTWGSTSRYTVGTAYANAGNTITFS